VEEDEVSDQQTVWLVWNPGHGAPNFKHYDSASAVREAERLARLHPGEKFYVMVSVGVAVVEQPSVYTAFSDYGVPF
jgi:hypothetical protein